MGETNVVNRFREILYVFFSLGCTSFGGPVAHLGYFHQELVVRRKWLSNKAFLDTVSLCQFLPGPSSSQVGMVIGLHRGGAMGAFAAWLGFTTPSAVVMICLAYGLSHLNSQEIQSSGALHGLRLAAVAIVAQAVLMMAKSFASERATATLAVISASCVLLWPSQWTQLAVMVGGLLIGGLAFRFAPKALENPQPATEPGKGASDPATSADPENHIQVQFGIRTGSLLLVMFLAVLIALPIVAKLSGNVHVAQWSAFYQTGSLVFGGGHVVLPLLEKQMVESGWVPRDEFLSGYGAAQAVSGPLFSFAAFLGALLDHGPYIWMGGLTCLIAIYLPSLFLVFGCLPFWEKLRHLLIAQTLLKATNAVVVGLLIAALYQPVWTSSVLNPTDFVLVAGCWLLLTVWKCPPVFAVILCAAGGALMEKI